MRGQMKPAPLALLVAALLPLAALAQTVEQRADGVVVKPLAAGAAAVRVQLVDDHIVRVSNRSAVAMRDCRFGMGMSIIEVGDLPPGATTTAERVGDLVGPLFSCTTEQSPLSFTEPARDVDLVGHTQVVVYRHREGLRLETSDE